MTDSAHSTQANTANLFLKLGSLVVRALDSRLHGFEFDYWPMRLVLGWATVFGWANYLSIS